MNTKTIVMIASLMLYSLLVRGMKIPGSVDFSADTLSLVNLQGRRLSNNLTRLNISDRSLVTVEYLQHLSRLYPDLQELIIDSEIILTEAIATALVNSFPKLITLKLKNIIILCTDWLKKELEQAQAALEQWARGLPERKLELEKPKIVRKSCCITWDNLE